MAQRNRYALCVKNRGYPAALDVRKVYQVLPDSAAEERGMLRVVDESRTDYLYPAGFFVQIELPREAWEAFRKKSA